MVDFFKHASVVDFRTRMMVKCIDKPSKGSRISVGKKYTVNMVGFNGGYRVISDSGRQVWYNSKYFIRLDGKSHKLGIIKKK